MRRWPLLLALLLCMSFPPGGEHSAGDVAVGGPVGEHDDADGDDPDLFARPATSGLGVPAPHRIAPPTRAPRRSRPEFLVRNLLI